MSELLPLFLNLTGRAVVLVGGGPVATAKLRQLLAAGARVRVIAPEITDEIQQVVARGFHPRDRGPEWAAPPPDATGNPVRVTLAQRRFVPADLDGAWLVVAAATPEVNRHVADVAETLRLFVNAVDDPANATAFLSGVVRRDGVTLAISTSGAAPALTALLREGIEALLPRDLATWMWQARAARVAWRREGVPMDARKPRLLQALNALYGRPEGLHYSDSVTGVGPHHGGSVTGVVPDFGPAVNVPWLNGPEDSWL
jgi:uroporphyrin-III C-methyltransferase / precorrin-2 dehydrogenase / sirohydrochlorin ferrochelatase